MDSRETDDNGNLIVRKFVNSKVQLSTNDSAVVYNNHFANMIKQDALYLYNTPQEKLSQLPDDILEKLTTFLQKWNNSYIFSQKEAIFFHQCVRAMEDVGF